MKQSYVYLHGFASSPASNKASYLSDRFQDQGIELAIPDLNQPDFFSLTLTRQIQQVGALIEAIAPPVILIGSSFGGLTAAWLAEHYPQVNRVVLLAPAFQFMAQWLPRLGEEALHQWQHSGSLPVYHYREQNQIPISYDFVEDLQQYDERHIRRSLPTLILHGVHDDVIRVQASRAFAQERPWVRIVELNSDHALGNVLDQVWEAICEFALC